jgi:hypothetical protein
MKQNIINDMVIIIILWVITIVINLFLNVPNYLGNYFWIFSFNTLLFIIVMYVPIKYSDIVLYLIAKKSYNLGKQKYHLDLKKADKATVNTYFRDQIINYSPGVLSYINDYQLDYDDIIATILSLEIKNKIKVNESQITIINSDTTNLDKNEILVLNHLIKGNINEISLVEYKDEVINDSLNKGLITVKNNFFLGNKRLIGVISLLIILAPFAFSILNFKIADQWLYLSYFLSFIIGFSLYGASASYNFQKFRNPYVKTATGKELSAKLIGLENYLRDFSDFESMNSADLILWKDYLIYSMIFGVNTKVFNEYKVKLALKFNSEDSI